ncbi:MAG: CARDB domain-containing protein [bacterium]|nr:CARDB domain-containing protein [bacterium]
MKIGRIMLASVLLLGSFMYAGSLFAATQFQVEKVELEKVDAIGQDAEDVRTFRIYITDPIEKMTISIWEYPHTSITDSPYMTTTISGSSGLTMYYVSPGWFTKKLKPNTSYTYRITAYKHDATSDMNNTYEGTFTTTSFSPLPDLTVTNVQYSSPSNTTGESGTLSVTIKNLGGDLTSGQGLYNWYMNFNAQDFIYDLSAFKSSRSMPTVADPLSVNESVTFSWEGTFRTAGNLYLHFTVDNANELREFNENNNTLSTTVTIKNKTSVTRPEISTFNVGDGHDYLIQGNTMNIQWSSKNAVYCIATGDWSGRKNVNGVERVTVQSYGYRNYGLQCYDNDGNISIPIASTLFAGSTLNAPRQDGDLRVLATPVTITSSGSVEINTTFNQQPGVAMIIFTESSATPSHQVVVFLGPDKINGSTVKFVPPLQVNTSYFYVITAQSGNVAKDVVVHNGSLTTASTGQFENPSLDKKPTVSIPETKKAMDARQIVDIEKKASQLQNNQTDQLLAELKELRDIVREQQSEIKYLKKVSTDLQNLNEQMKQAVTTFVTYGIDDNTKRLGAGERAAVINSYKTAFNKLPETDEELQDLFRIANGRFPSLTNKDAEKRAKNEFRMIYKRVANMENANDRAAITVMAYGLRQSAQNRNLNSESAAISVFQRIYGHVPQKTEEWNTMQAIAYSGASRNADRDKDGLSDEDEASIGTDADNPDTDSDGHPDGTEVDNGFSPLK